MLCLSIDIPTECRLESELMLSTVCRVRIRACARVGAPEGSGAPHVPTIKPCRKLTWTCAVHNT